jgi:hypothetical protein
VTWANLGYLYLRLDDGDLANQCFLKAQIIDPDYGPCSGVVRTCSHAFRGITGVSAISSSC